MGLIAAALVLGGFPQGSVQPFFTANSNAPYEKIYSVLASNERSMDDLTDKLYLVLAQSGNRQRESQDLSAVATILKTRTDALLAENAPQANTALKQWMYAEAISGWIRMNMRYDWDMLKSANRYELNQSYSVLSRFPATGTCGGFARVGLMLARKLGVQAWHLGGSNRGWGLLQTDKDTHGWNLFQIGGMLIPADSCVDIDIKEPWNTKGKTKEWESMPRRRECWELFLARHYNTYWIDVPDNEKGCENQPYDKDPLTKMTFEIWGQKDTNYMLQLQRYMERVELERHRRLKTL